MQELRQAQPRSESMRNQDSSSLVVGHRIEKKTKKRKRKEEGTDSDAEVVDSRVQS